LPGVPRPLPFFHDIWRAYRCWIVTPKKPPVIRCTEGRKRNERGGKNSKPKHQTALRQQT
jgi:hypothetical protein